MFSPVPAVAAACASSPPSSIPPSSVPSSLTFPWHRPSTSPALPRPRLPPRNCPRPPLHHAGPVPHRLPPPPPPRPAPPRPPPPPFPSPPGPPPPAPPPPAAASAPCRTPLPGRPPALPPATRDAPRLAARRGVARRRRPLKVPMRHSPRE